MILALAAFFGMICHTLIRNFLLASTLATIAASVLGWSFLGSHAASWGAPGFFKDIAMVVIVAAVVVSLMGLFVNAIRRKRQECKRTNQDEGRS